MSSNKRRRSVGEFAFLFPLLRPYRGKMALMFALVLCVAALGQLPPLLTAWIVDRAIIPHNVALLLSYIGIMALSALASSLLGVWQGYLNTVIGEGLMRDVRDMMVQKLHRMPLKFFSASRTGEIMNRVCGDVATLSSFVTGTFVTLVSSVIAIVLSLAFMFALDWHLTLLSMLIIPLMAIPLSPAGSKLFDLQKQAREQQDTLNSHLQETLSVGGMLLIKSFVRESLEGRKFHDIGTRMMRIEIELLMAGRWFMALVNATLVLGPASIWLAGGLLAIKGGISIGVVVAFISYLARLYAPASTLAALHVQMTSSMAILDRIREYVEMSGEEALDLPARADAPSVKSIAYRNVNFGFLPGNTVVHDATFEVRPGEVVAFVGPSGAGKTAMLQLLPRLYECSSGSISIGGVDVGALSLAQLRSMIGNITQDAYFFNGSLRENLLYGRPDASDEQIVEACRMAQLSDFLERLPDGLDTVVGERGHKMSGGERQRLAIARIILKDPPILLLDEATSSLDSRSERLVQDALETLMRGRTSLVISHRLSTIMRADQIHVVVDGRIVESGTHGNLLERAGAYSRLYHEQFSHPLEAAGALEALS